MLGNTQLLQTSSVDVQHQVGLVRRGACAVTGAHARAAVQLSRINSATGAVAGVVSANSFSAQFFSLHTLPLLVLLALAIIVRACPRSVRALT